MQGALVGSSESIECRALTVLGVNSVMISWIGPGGTITNNTRIGISPTTSDDNAFTSTLHFEYLSEEDKGNYTCKVTILQTKGLQSFQIQSLTSEFLFYYGAAY